MSTLAQLLEKRGIKDINELRGEELKTYEIYRKALAKEDYNVGDILGFCDIQIALIENQFDDLDAMNEKLSRLVLLHHVYKSIKNFIIGPKTEREAMERQLTDMLKR